MSEDIFSCQNLDASLLRASRIQRPRTLLNTPTKQHGLPPTKKRSDYHSVEARAFNPHTQEAKACGSLWSWSTQWVLGQSELSKPKISVEWRNSAETSCCFLQMLRLGPGLHCRSEGGAETGKKSTKPPTQWPLGWPPPCLAYPFLTSSLWPESNGIRGKARHGTDHPQPRASSWRGKQCRWEWGMSGVKGRPRWRLPCTKLQMGWTEKSLQWRYLEFYYFVLF